MNIRNFLKQLKINLKLIHIISFTTFLLLFLVLYSAGSHHLPAWIKNFLFPQKLIEEIPLLYVIPLTVLFILYHQLIVRLYNYFKKTKSTFSFDLETDLKRNFLFQGPSHIKQIDNTTILVVEGAEGGILVKDLYCRNFRLSCEFQIEKGSFGICFQAQDHNNYFMVQVSKGAEVNPHVRQFGDWERFFSFQHEPVQLQVDNWNNLNLESKDGEVALEINGNLVGSWVLPTHTRPNIIHSRRSRDEDSIQEKEKGVTHEIYFLNLPGMIGFRTWITRDIVEIKNLEIEKL